jgi:hypothetical protein
VLAGVGFLPCRRSALPVAMKRGISGGLLAVNAERRGAPGEAALTRREGV